jgi:hypothetical protein
MMIVHADQRAIARARSAVNEARSLISDASRACKFAANCPAGEIPAALEAAQAALEQGWEALAYIDTELAIAGGDL